MRAPTTKRLLEAFRDLDLDGALLIRKLARATDDADALRKLVDERCPETSRYVRGMHSDPYRSRMWRITVALHAIDKALGTHGVEPLGPRDDFRAEGPPYEYCNAGDPYTTTLVYTRSGDTLWIGCWGGIAERNPDW